MFKFKSEEDLNRYKSLLQELLEAGTLSSGSFMQLTNEAVRSFFQQESKLEGEDSD